MKAEAKKTTLGIVIIILSAIAAYLNLNRIPTDFLYICIFLLCFKFVE